MPKVATLGQRGRNGGGIKFLGVPTLVILSLKSCILFFALLHPHMHKTILQQNREFEAAFPSTLGDTAPQKPPVFGFFALWPKLQPLQIHERVIYHWKEHKKLNKMAPTQFLVLPPWENHDPQSRHLKKASFCSKFKAWPYWTRTAQLDATYVTYAPYSLL